MSWSLDHNISPPRRKREKEKKNTCLIQTHSHLIQEKKTNNLTRENEEHNGVRRDRVFVVPIPRLTYLTEARPDPNPDKEPVRDFQKNATMNEWNTPKR